MVVYSLTLILSLTLFIKPSVAVIYNLNASEFARMPPIYALDEYETCLSRERGLYCLVRLNLFDDGQNPLLEMIHRYSENHVKHYNHSIIERGVCVHDACGKFINESSQTEEALKLALAVCLNESIWHEYRLQANVSAVFYCDSNSEADDSNFVDWAVMAAFVSIIVVNLAASFYDYKINYCRDKVHVGKLFLFLNIGNKYILSFSMIQNFNWLISFKPKNSKTQVLQFIHFVRALTNFLMVLAHAMLTIAGGYTVNTHDFEKTYEHVFYQLIYNGMMIVQIFFFISGFLLAYHFQIYTENNKVTWFDIPKVMFLRIFRLLPSLAVVIAFSATWLRYLGSGPLWKLFVTNSVVADCRTYWWHHLLFINNYMQDDKFCAIPTWHIAADSQLYVVGLIACVASVRYRQARGTKPFAILLLAGTLIPVAQVWLQDLDGVMVMTPEFYRTLENATFRNGHVGGHSNLQCFVVGMAVAFLIYNWQNKGVDLAENKYFSLVFWLSPVLVALSFYSGHVFYADGERASLLVRMLYAGGHRLIVAGISGLFTIGMTLNAPSYFRVITEWRGWTIPSRLSFSLYLLHMNIVHFLMGRRMQLTQVSFYNLAIAHVGIVILSYILAVPFLVMVEAPFNRLMKSLLESSKPSELAHKNKVL